MHLACRLEKLGMEYLMNLATRGISLESLLNDAIDRSAIVIDQLMLG